MQFPNRDRMTEEECLANANAAKDLTPGLHYRFDPAVEATGIPTGGPEAFAPRQFHFSRGWYLGFQDGNHVFQGKPDEKPKDIDPRLLECYFHVLFIGGVSCTPDPDQSKPE